MKARTPLYCDGVRRSRCGSGCCYRLPCGIDRRRKSRLADSEPPNPRKVWLTPKVESGKGLTGLSGVVSNLGPRTIHMKWHQVVRGGADAKEWWPEEVSVEPGNLASFSIPLDRVFNVDPDAQGVQVAVKFASERERRSDTLRDRKEEPVPEASAARVGGVGHLSAARGSISEPIRPGSSGGS